MSIAKEKTLKILCSASPFLKHNFKMSETMQAIIISKLGGPEALQYQTVPKPTPLPGFAQIHVKAFGVNHAEMHMRRGEWDEWNPISGLECVGLVVRLCRR
jgi:NADPH:quinone reductase-like Zn-dependent oxidoreductase